MSVTVTCAASGSVTTSTDLPLNEYVNLVPTLSFTLAGTTLIEFTGFVMGMDANAQFAQLVVDGGTNNPYQQDDLTGVLAYMTTLDAGEHTFDYQGFAFNSEGTVTYAAASVMDLTTG